mmetsp:Transcript_18182/g.21000  ORF Transcript_18182/g.21000 Transcript_18182/m.21000 type:complete len:91 (+) Transcript_18182:75-347(+)
MKHGFSKMWESEEAKNCYLIGSGVFVGYVLVTGGPGIVTIILASFIVISMSKVLAKGEDGRSKGSFIPREVVIKEKTSFRKIPLNVAFKN